MDNNGLIGGEAFLPDERQQELRANGDRETSINWEDDETVETRTLADASGTHGAARMPRTEIDRATRRDSTAGFVFAERTSKPTNPHHGDIVYRAACDPRRTKMLASAFALESTFVPPRRAGPQE